MSSWSVEGPVHSLPALLHHGAAPSSLWAARYSPLKLTLQERPGPRRKTRFPLISCKWLAGRLTQRP